MVNPFINPIFVSRVLIELTRDQTRIIKWDKERIKRYQLKRLREVIRYASTVPVYETKYKESDVSASKIRSLEDLVALPLIGKDEFIKGFPSDIIPKTRAKMERKIVSTGGSSGKPVSLFVDWYEIVKSYGTFFAQIRAHGFDPLRMRYMNIGNLNPYRADQEYGLSVLSKIPRFLPLRKKVCFVSVNTPPLELLDKIEKFKPDYIMTYGGTLLNLANYLRGYPRTIAKPKILATSGAILDSYTRGYIEDVFGCKIMDVYACVESGCAIAFQCREGRYHIHSDFIILEAIDDKGERVAVGERGKSCLTKLYHGKGTPIVRYSGLDDWIILSDEKCPCGIETPLIERIEGRISNNIVLPNGVVFPPGAFTFIADVLHELGTFKVKRYQIVQTDIYHIEIRVMIDEDLREIGPPVELILEKIEERYREKVGDEVKIEVKEVDKIEDDKVTGKPAPVVISHVDIKKAIDKW